MPFTRVTGPAPPGWTEGLEGDVLEESFGPSGAPVRANSLPHGTCWIYLPELKKEVCQMKEWTFSSLEAMRLYLSSTYVVETKSPIVVQSGR